LRVRIDAQELRLLGGICTDELGPDGLVPGRIVELALLDGTEHMIEGSLSRAIHDAVRARGRSKGGRELFLFISGESATEGRQRNVTQGVIITLPRKLCVGQGLDAGLELAQEAVDGKSKAVLARMDEKLALNFKADLAITARLDDEIRLRGRTISEHALEATGLDAAALDL
jgi:hypothetical protein